MSFLVATDDSAAVKSLLVGREGAVSRHRRARVTCPPSPRLRSRAAATCYAFLWQCSTMRKARSRSIENLFARYADCLVAQMFQSAACNAAHFDEERTAKWIGAAIERSGSKRKFR